MFWNKGRPPRVSGEAATALEHGETQARRSADRLKEVRKQTAEFFKTRTGNVRGKGRRIVSVKPRNHVHDAEWLWQKHLPNQVEELDDLTREVKVYVSLARRATAALKAGKPTAVNLGFGRNKRTTIQSSPEVVRLLPDFENRVLAPMTRTAEDAQTLKTAFETALAKQRGGTQH